MKLADINRTKNQKKNFPKIFMHFLVYNIALEKVLPLTDNI